ncbi:MAG: polysaccharide pyruvyl transferase family protein [bacterium]|nr:polysaccharide pyruvyl transferase family protein [bacterium]MDE0440352.1 polysaccharide pyruvyl transferase family protein [bacterium]
MTSRIAIAGWFGSDNLGDELILRSLVGSLSARGAEPVAVSIDPDDTTRIHGIEAVPHRSPLDYLRLGRALRETHGLVVAGGLIQTETSVWNLPFHASRLHSARDLAGCAVGLGVGRVGGPLAVPIARGSLRRLRLVVVRDHDSADRLRGWGLENVRVGSDPVIGDRVDALAPEDTMCVILRPPNRRGIGTAASKAAPPSSATSSALASGLEAVADATGLSIRMVTFQASRDLPVHRSIADRLGGEVELVTPRLASVIEEVGRSRLVITMRYHGAIAALLHGRPAVLLDYSPKMASLAAEGGRWAPLLNPLEPEPDRMVRAAEAALGVTSRAIEVRGALRYRLAENDRALDAIAGAGP